MSWNTLKSHANGKIITVAMN